jgi:hypothetical protein
VPPLLSPPPALVAAAAAAGLLSLAVGVDPAPGEPASGDWPFRTRSFAMTARASSLIAITSARESVPAAPQPSLPAKTGIFEPFIYRNDHFAKTGSGQTWGKLKKKMPFFAPRGTFGRKRSYLQKPAFWSHLYIKTNILPRQARDKHRENSKKSAFL